MNKEKKYLITTCDKNTWMKEGPVIFLGEWCKDYNLKSIWEKMDAIVASPYGVLKKERDRDYNKARKIENNLTQILAAELNNIHNENKSPRYWRVLFAPWLRRYIEVMINRIQTINQLLNNYEISGTTYFNDIKYSLACQDSRAAIYSYDDKLWNNILYKKIIHKLNKNIKSKIIKNESNGFVVNDENNLIKKILYIFFLYVRKVIKSLSSNNNGVYLDSKLNLKEKIKLYFYFKQLPIFWISKILNLHIPNNQNKRLSLNSAMKKIEYSDQTEKIIYEMVFELIPVCYLEGYNKLKNLSNKMGLPSKPKFIFTSYAYDYDDLFKMWAAENIEKGSKYIISQHGNNYGTHRYINPSVEETLADKFLTWGWKYSDIKYQKSFIFKTSGFSLKKNLKSKKLLIIQEDVHHRYWTYDHYNLYNIYFEKLKNFTNHLSSDVKNEIVIRVHNSYKNHTFNEYKRWLDFDPNLNLELSTKNYWESIKNSKLVVFTYDTTGLLELLSLNIPFIAFWETGTDHLRDDVVIDYNLLKEQGIIHYSTESASNKIHEIWDDVDKWWNKGSLQNARKIFCDKYARTVDEPAKEIKNIILTI